MTPEKSDQSPIDPAELEMHARVEIGLIDAFPGYDAMKPPAPASTAPHPRTPNKLAGNAQNNLHLRSYGGLTAHLGG